MNELQPPIINELGPLATSRWIPIAECVPPYIEENKLFQRSARFPVIIRDPHPRVDTTRFYWWKVDGHFAWGKEGVTHWLYVPEIPDL